jgi:hypothetical protein
MREINQFITLMKQKIINQIIIFLFNMVLPEAFIFHQEILETFSKKDKDNEIKKRL